VCLSCKGNPSQSRRTAADSFRQLQTAVAVFRVTEARSARRMATHDTGSALAVWMPYDVTLPHLAPAQFAVLMPRRMLSAEELCTTDRSPLR
jgi:hypothetical protein